MDLTNDIFYNELIEKIKKDLKERVKEKRYNHSCLVAEEAKKLAEIYGENPREAYITGLAHDIAKDFTDEENRYFVEKYNLPKEILVPEYEKILHSDIGAVVCREWYDFSDEMCRAIKYHTIGNAEMTTFEKIIYIADKIGRTVLPDDLKGLPEKSYNNLDDALLYFLIKQKIKLEESGIKQSDVTIKLMNSLKGDK